MQLNIWNSASIFAIASFSLFSNYCSLIDNLQSIFERYHISRRVARAENSISAPPRILFCSHTCHVGDVILARQESDTFYITTPQLANKIDSGDGQTNRCTQDTRMSQWTDRQTDTRDSLISTEWWARTGYLADTAHKNVQIRMGGGFGDTSAVCLTLLLLLLFLSFFFLFFLIELARWQRMKEWARSKMERQRQAESRKTSLSSSSWTKYQQQQQQREVTTNKQMSSWDRVKVCSK